MESKYEEMARQMRADGVSEETIARFVTEEMEEDEFRRCKGVAGAEKDPRAHPQAAARQRVLPQLRHDGVRTASPSPRVRPARKQAGTAEPPKEPRQNSSSVTSPSARYASSFWP